MKYHAGDRVRLVGFNKEGVIENTEGSKLHPYYVVSDDGTVEDYFTELDMEPSKIPVLNDAAIDRILVGLHLPMHDPEQVKKLREVVRQAVSLAPALPERRELPERDTLMNQDIANDANMFEAILGFNPLRRNSSAYPWGWCYVSETVQRQFQDYCSGPKNKGNIPRT
jgi:hypothetical protein